MDPLPLVSGGGVQLVPGQLIARRFEVIRFLARGGMGEVYEVSDRDLQGKRLALKTVRAEIASSERGRQRFEREVLLAREVVHPNVCPTYDLFRVEPPDPPLMFLTMKLIRGESLAGLLRRMGKLDLELALDLAHQMAAGLDAAHQAGVVHRDFKPGNVLLESSGERLHATITDFGLSRAEDSDTTIGLEGHIAGTLGYIAPEVLMGHTASPASDVYAFGVVLHEMVTGARPRPDGQGQSFLSPRTIDKDLPEAWERVIMGCLERSPSKRFPSAGAALMPLAGPLPGSSSRNVLTPGRRTILGGATVAAALVAGGVAGWPPLWRMLHPLPSRRFVALLEWPPQPDLQLRTLIRSALDAIRDRVARAESEDRNLLVLAAGDPGTPGAPKALGDVTSALGANLALTASVSPAGTGYRMTLDVLDPATGRSLRKRNLEASQTLLAGLALQAVEAAATLLDLPAKPSPPGDQEDAARLPAPAFQLFRQAEEARRQPNNSGLDAAIESYQKLLESRPNFALGYASLSLAYTQKYQRLRDPALLELARNNADVALRHRPNSPRAVFSHALVDGFTGQPARAIEQMNQALALDPGDPQILLYRAAAFRNLGLLNEEEQGYRELIRLRPNFWPAYQELGLVYYRRNQYERAAQMMGQAAAAAPNVAAPLANQAAMFLLMGKDDEAESAYRRSLERAPYEVAYSGLGSIAFRRRDYRAALQSYEKAKLINPNRAVTWRNIGDCQTMLNNRAAEIASYTRAAELQAGAVKLNPGNGTDWIYLAFYQAKCGRMLEAERALREARQRTLDLRARFTEVQTLAVLGRKREALDLLLTCIDNGLSLVDAELALDLKDLRNDPRYRAHVSARARKA